MVLMVLVLEILSLCLEWLVSSSPSLSVNWRSPLLVFKLLGMSVLMVLLRVVLVLVSLGDGMGVLNALVVDRLVDVELVDVGLMKMMLVEVVVMEVLAVKVVLVEEMLMVVVTVKDLLMLVMLMEQMLMLVVVVMNLFVMRMLLDGVFMVMIILHEFWSMGLCHVTLVVSVDWGIVDHLWPAPSTPSPTSVVAMAATSVWTIFRTAKVAASGCGLVIARSVAAYIL